MKPNDKNQTERPPVIVIMGHIDHGKSTLLDYIRKTNIVAKEAGGITQHISAYEVSHKGKDNKEHKITFIDTPGHEAFSAMRARGSQIADIAVLVVSAEDGVKPQTTEALKSILKAKIPYVIAINKIDKPGADIERTKQSLAENEIYIEGYGGNIPAVPISAKTGEGIPELLDMLLLVAEIEELRGNPEITAKGIVIESNLDTKKGISATLIIKDGTVKKGTFVVTEESFSPVRIMEDFAGKSIQKATFSSPIKIIGWNKMPQMGAEFFILNTKKEAEEYIYEHKATTVAKKISENKEEVIFPIILKADRAGSMEALMHEINKLGNEKVKLEIAQSGIGSISENDVKSAIANNNINIVGFNVKVDSGASNLALRLGVDIQIFEIIYKLTEWLAEKIAEKVPVVEIEETTGRAKIQKLFNKVKDKQIVGGKVVSGTISVGESVNILRREAKIGTGKIKELQAQKIKTSEVSEGSEFGTMIESKIELAPGDFVETFTIVKKQITTTQ